MANLRKKDISFVQGKETDIDRLLLVFNSWQQAFETQSNDYEILTQKEKSLQQQISLQNVNENLLHEEMTEMKRVHDEFQKILERRCTTEEENWALKTSVKCLQEDKGHLEQKIVEMEKHWEEQEKKTKEEAEETLTQVLATAREENGREADSLRDEIKSSAEEKSELKQRIQRLEREKHAEVTKLRLKYDAKLLHLQQETAKAQQHAKSPVNRAATDIFCQKYINTKQSTDREIKSLKKTIAEFQKNLDQRTDTGATGAKKRRF